MRGTLHDPRGPRVEGVAEVVGDGADAGDGGEAEEAGEDDAQGGAVEGLQATLQEGAPRGDGGWDAEAEEAERALVEDDLADLQGGGDEERREGVGEDVPSEHVELRRPQAAGG